MDTFVAVAFVVVFLGGVFVGYKFGKPIGMRIAAVEICGKEAVEYAESKFNTIKDVINHLKEIM